MVARGLKDPLLVIFDGAPGLHKAVRCMWLWVFRQRCQVHKMRNILAKLPRLMQQHIKPLVQQVFLAPSYALALKGDRVQTLALCEDVACGVKQLQQLRAETAARSSAQEVAA